ncbi:MAG: nicotinate-nucleotide adenylyltransferase [Candidatus Aminicenantes bacterium]|nr:MAG: nicotinate-nucleotide adenylyltransferase [Candidatus Aminicenantes bacterium]
MKKERIGLFGGTFNPIHRGHLRAAETVQKRLLLDKILFIPSYIPPHKESVEIASPFHRLKMVELTLESYPKFLPSSIEIEARGKSYSIITLNKIKKLYPEASIFFILGIDAFLEIDTWKDHEDVLTRCFFVVISRPGYELKKAKEFLKGKYKERVVELPKTGAEGNELPLTAGIFFLAIDAIDVASTAIREKIRKGDSIKNLVSEPVEAYIRKNRIYQ